MENVRNLLKRAKIIGFSAAFSDKKKDVPVNAEFLEKIIFLARIQFDILTKMSALLKDAGNRDSPSWAEVEEEFNDIVMQYEAWIKDI